MESIKLINEIIIRYVQSQRKELGKAKRNDVISLLRDDNIDVLMYSKLLMT